MLSEMACVYVFDQHLDNGLVRFITVKPDKVFHEYAYLQLGQFRRMGSPTQIEVIIKPIK